jgi:carbamoyltransferase
VGEWATATYGTDKGTEIKILKEIRFPHSLRLLYSVFTTLLGFEVNEGEYKVKGIASSRQRTFLDKVYKLIWVENDGSFQLDMDFSAFHHSTERTYNQEFLDLFAPPHDGRLRVVSAVAMRGEKTSAYARNPSPQYPR